MKDSSMNENYSIFAKDVKRAADKFRAVKKDETIRLISHIDCDGLCAAAVMIGALKNDNRKYSFSIIKQLEESIILDLKKEDYKVFVFTDLGCGQLESITKHLSDRRVFILDHHDFDKALLETLPENITVLNPHTAEIQGSDEISGAGVAYLFSEELNPKNKEFSHLAIIGALGDVQEKEGFFGLNIRLLETAIKENKIKVEKGLRWFGLESKSIYQLLLYGADISVPGITGNESSIIEFLNQLGISPRIDGRWTRYNDLDDAQKANFISAIVLKRSKEKNPEGIIGNRYLLVDEEPSSVLKDAKEFSTLLNACGRMDKASFGIGACLNDSESKKNAINTLNEYKQEIIASLRWYESQEKSGHVIKGENYIIINAHDNVMPTIIGTLASILSNSKDVKKGTIIISMAKDEDKIKVSIRAASNGNEKDLRDIITKICEKIEGQSGGHKNAAGAIIDKDKEQEFIKEAVKFFEENNMSKTSD
jgi:single-stranded-DNA-specific exonuclease